MSEFTQEQMARHIDHLLGPCDLCDEIRAIVSDYERARPLLEAVEKADYREIEWCWMTSRSPRVRPQREILYAALAYREAKNTKG